jgi:hypothetical protein
MIASACASLGRERLAALCAQLVEIRPDCARFRVRILARLGGFGSIQFGVQGVRDARFAHEIVRGQAQALVAEQCRRGIAGQIRQ